MLNILDVGPGIGLFFGHAFIWIKCQEPWHTLLFQPISLQILGYGKGSPILFVLITKLPASKKNHIKVVSKICWYLTIKIVTSQVLLISIFNLKVGLSEKHTKFEKIFLMVLTNQLIYLENVKTTRKIFSNYVYFSKSPNFIVAHFKIRVQPEFLLLLLMNVNQI